MGVEIGVGVMATYQEGKKGVHRMERRAIASGQPLGQVKGNPRQPKSSHGWGLDFCACMLQQIFFKNFFKCSDSFGALFAASLAIFAVVVPRSPLFP